MRNQPHDTQLIARVSEKTKRTSQGSGRLQMIAFAFILPSDREYSCEGMPETSLLKHSLQRELRIRRHYYLEDTILIYAADELKSE